MLKPDMRLKFIALTLLTALIGAMVTMPLPAMAQGSDEQIYLPMIGTIGAPEEGDPAIETEWAKVESLINVPANPGKPPVAFTPGTEPGTIRLEGVEDETNVIGLPDADASSGRFISVVRGLSSLGDTGNDSQVFNISLRIPASLAGTGFKLFIFDGDMRRGPGGGTWDATNPTSLTPDSMTYRLYPDPDINGNTTGELYSWPDSVMPDNAWCQLNTSGGCGDNTATIPVSPAALNAATGDYFYHLVVEFDEPQFPTDGTKGERNDFKVAVTGQPFLRGGSTVGFIGFGPNDPLPSRFPPTTYDGTFEFDFFVAEPTEILTLWDGDLDYYFEESKFEPGDETDDENSPFFPPFLYGSETKPEGKNPGNGPQDGLEAFMVNGAEVPNTLRIGDEPYYTIESEAFLETNEFPSGNQEWERFVLAITGSTDPDLPAEGPDKWLGNPGDKFDIGLYRWKISDVDGRNMYFLHLDYDLYAAGVGAIGDTVWAEVEGEQRKFEPGDIGISNVLLLLYKDNGDGVFGAGDQLVDQETTDDNGKYLFTSVPLGVYFVVVADSNFAPGGPLEGMSQVTDFSGPADQDDYNRATPHKVVLDSNLAYLRADFGYLGGGQSGENSIGNFVWQDTNENGVWDDGEPAIPGVLVNLYQCDDVDPQDCDPTPIAWTLTGPGDNVNGNYLFTGLANGNYKVEIDPSNFNAGGALASMMQTLVTGTDEDSYNHALPWYVQGLGSAPDLIHYKKADFSFNLGTGSIGDFIWEDENGDGIWTAGENPIPNVLVNLYVESSPGVWTLIKTDTTDNNGNYLFTELVAGNYRVEVDPSNFVAGGALEDKVQTPAIVTSAADPDEGNNKNHSMPWEQTLAQGQNYLFADFGYFGVTTCVIDPNDPNNPNSTAVIQWYFSTFNGTPVVVIRATLPRGFADTSYGAPANGRWAKGPKGDPAGRTFREVLHSDHMEFRLFGNNNPSTAYMAFKVDLLARDVSVPGLDKSGPGPGDGYTTNASFDPAGPSPFQSSGLLAKGGGPDRPCGGGAFELCDGGEATTGGVTGLPLDPEIAAVLDVRTSFEVNMNLRFPADHPKAGQLAWTDYLNSPALGTPEYSFAPGEDQFIKDNWIWDTWYEITIDLSAFNSVGGFHSATIPSLHSSPARTKDTITVVPCPPEDNPPPDPEPCPDCDTYIKEVTLRYEGAMPAAVKVLQADNQTRFNDILSPGDEFTVVGTFQAPNDWLGPQTNVYINGVLEATLPTDCTPVLTAGTQFGQVELLSMLNRDGGNGCGVAGP